MKLSVIVPGTDYQNGEIVRRVIRLEGAVRHQEEFPSEVFEAGKKQAVKDILKGMEEGCFKGRVRKEDHGMNGIADWVHVAAYRDLREATVGYLEGDLTTPHEVSLQEFADWAESRV